MKIRYIKYWAFAAVLGMGTVSCEDFLNRPTEDNYNESNFYQNDEQCVQGLIIFITHLGMTFSAVLLKSVKSCPKRIRGKQPLLEFYGEWYG